ncbi:uncharacterized protein LOC135153503 [Lytechinus pictus]|uniref:uncharacterized protein LOC135153503 n=1 Tax=Lytechinus pictus TaxID=7653 RepID=UPI0030BA1609
MKMLYSEASARCPGTLANIKEEYFFRHASKEAMKSFNHTEEFLHFSVEAFIVLLAMDIMEIKTIDEIPKGYPTNGPPHTKSAYQLKVAMELLQRIWNPIPQDAIDSVTSTPSNSSKVVAANQPYPYCFCKKGMAGWEKARIRHDLQWNRTANLQGIKGKCLPLDRVCEILDKSSKGVLSNSTKYSGKNLIRAGALGGPESSRFDQSKLLASTSRKHTISTTYNKRKMKTKRELIPHFVKLMSSKGLFSVKAGRSHKAFPNFKRTQPLERLGKLKSSLMEASVKLDWERPDIQLEEQTLIGNVQYVQTTRQKQDEMEYYSIPCVLYGRVCKTLLEETPSGTMMGHKCWHSGE